MDFNQIEFDSNEIQLIKTFVQHGYTGFQLQSFRRLGMRKESFQLKSENLINSQLLTTNIYFRR